MYCSVPRTVPVKLEAFLANPKSAILKTFININVLFNRPHSLEEHFEVLYLYVNILPCEVAQNL